MSAAHYWLLRKARQDPQLVAGSALTVLAIMGLGIGLTAIYSLYTAIRDYNTDDKTALVNRETIDLCGNSPVADNCIKRTLDTVAHLSRSNDPPYTFKLVNEDGSPSDYHEKTYWTGIVSGEKLVAWAKERNISFKMTAQPSDAILSLSPNGGVLAFSTRLDRESASLAIGALLRDAWQTEALHGKGPRNSCYVKQSPPQKPATACDFR